MIFAVEEIEVVVAHRERATVRVGDVFLKIDGDQTRVDLKVQAMGDALSDLATLTLGHPEHLDYVIAGYGTDVDRDLIRAWWSLRCLSNLRWLHEHGYGEIDHFPEAAVLLRE